MSGAGRAGDILDCHYGAETMSKAFTKETDVEDDEPVPQTALPAGAKNYMTRQGFERLQAELRALLNVERPKVVELVSWAAGNGDRSENGDYIYGKKRLGEIDRRIRHLTRRLESAEVVDPERQRHLEQVFFGATVTYADANDAERTIAIVGVDEADIERNLVSWISPVARALMKARIGDIVEVRTPGGTERIEVVAIRYGA
jgi:transcription elongation factor GreB